ncbi:MAG: hypothetical protein WBM02_04970 [bacterium]
MNQIDSSQEKIDDRRAVGRKKLTTPLRAKFTLEIDALVTEISPEGMTIIFDPIKDGVNRVNKPIPMHLEMNGNLVSVDASVRQVSSNSDHIRLGISYDRSQIAVFYSPPMKNTQDSD